MTTAHITLPERISLPPMASTPGRPAAPTSGFGPEDILRALRQRFFLIMFLWFLSIGATVGITYLLWTKFPSYTAEANVLVESPTPDIPYQLYQPEVQPQVLERFVMNQVQLVESPQVLADALQDVAVQGTDWFQKAKNELDVIKELETDLQVAPVRGTSFLNIRMTTRSPLDPHVIANAVMNAYLHTAGQLSVTPLRDELKQYQADLETIQKLLTAKADEIDSFILRLDPGAATEGSLVMVEIGNITKLLAEATAEKKKAEGLWKSYRTVGPDAMAVSPELQQMIETDPRIARMQAELDQLLELQTIMLGQFGEGHKQVKRFASNIATRQEALSELRAGRMRQLREYLTEQAELQYLAALETEVSLQEKSLELMEKQKEIDQQMVKLNRLQEDKKALQEKLTRADDYTDQLELMVKSERTVRVRPIAMASEPKERSFPNWKLMIPGGTLLGLALSLGFALLLELIDTSVRAPVDIVRAVRVPLLGTVPDLDDEEVTIDAIETAVRTAPHSMVAEAFRTIRTNLLFSGPQERQRCLLVTSPRPEDGKTSIAINLATVVAQSGRRVLLIDANFRRPSLRRIFSISRSEGLSNVLIGQASFESVIHTTDLPNLDVLASGPIPPNPTEILGSPYMRDMISKAIDQYDQVILDGPPVLLVSDSLVLATVADGVILVVRAKANSRGVANRARDLLTRVNAHIFGGVLNAARIRRGGYFREQLRTFYDYRPEEAPAMLDAESKDKSAPADQTVSKPHAPDRLTDADFDHILEDVHSADGIPEAWVAPPAGQDSEVELKPLSDDSDEAPRTDKDRDKPAS